MCWRWWRCRTLRRWMDVFGTGRRLRGVNGGWRMFGLTRAKKREPSLELSNKTFSAFPAYRAGIGVRGNLQRDALRAGGVRRSRRAADASVGGTIPKGVCAATGAGGAGSGKRSQRGSHVADGDRLGEAEHRSIDLCA